MKVGLKMKHGSETRKLLLKVVFESKTGGETGNLCLKIKLKKETRKLVLRDKTKKKEKFNQPTTNSLAQTGVNR